MSKKLRLACGILAIVGVSFLNACKDDEPPVRTVTFEMEEQEVTESDGTLTSFHPEAADGGEGRVIQVKLLFNSALAGNAVLKFDVEGTARENATSNEVNDFEILDEGENVTIDDDEITILKGATEATFDILIFEDAIFDVDEDEEVLYETIILSLESVVSGPIKLGEQVEHTVKILEDDAVALMQWQANDMTPAAAAVDMDIIFWFNGTVEWAGAREGTAFEAVNIPAGLGEGNVGISYTYYGGLSNDLDFAGFFYSTAGTLNGQSYNIFESDPLVFEGHYTLANINEWSAASLPKVAQTMTKSGINYANMSQITPFATGSRMRDLGRVKLDQKMILKQLTSRSNQKLFDGILKK
jgi:hypothetical protein